MFSLQRVESHSHNIILATRNEQLLTGPSTLLILVDYTLPRWHWLHPPFRWWGTPWNRSVNKCIVLAKSPTAIGAKAVPPPGMTWVKPLARVVDGETELVWWWSGGRIWN